MIYKKTTPPQVAGYISGIRGSKVPQPLLRGGRGFNYVEVVHFFYTIVVTTNIRSAGAGGCYPNANQRPTIG